MTGRSTTTDDGSSYEDNNVDYARQCRVADTTDFLEKLLPVSGSVIKRVLDNLTGSHYDGTRWKDFPSGEIAIQGKALYAPFIKVANAIRTAARDLAAATNDVHGVSEWVDYYSQAAEPSLLDAARPDCLLAHNVSHFATKNWPTSDGGASEKVSTPPDAEEKETQRKKALQASNWWLQIICAVEMRRKDSQKTTDIIKQLIGHMRRVLSEQLDRRFVFGLTLGPKRMTVWLHDRSGVLGTSESFDIHQDPHSFIRVIAAFSVLPAEQLGFDTQMKFYASPDNIIPTYLLNHEAALVFLTAPSKERKWVITTNGNEQYLTVKALSISRTRVMQGPASLVWAVVAFKDGQVASKKILVLKQCWRPVGSTSEQEMLFKVKDAADDTSGEDFVVHIQFEETISVEGKEDITGSLIRKGLKISNSKRTTDADERYLRVNVTDDDSDIMSIVACTSSRPVSRIHTRLLLSTFGWPLKNFKTRREAVRGIRDAVVGHEYVYHNGLLHRDISLGNIILTWCDGEDGTTGLGTKGCLIDFDRSMYGKENTETEAPANFPVSDRASADRRASLFHEVVEVQDMMHTIIDGSVMVAGSAAVDSYDLYKYVAKAWKHVSSFATLSPGHTVDAAVLQWTKVLQRFSFQTTEEERQLDSPTGTQPYMSGEILSRYRYSRGSNVFHDALHDMESFFWVLIHICLTHSGPGQRRQELDGDSDSEEHKILRFIVYCFFGAKPADLGGNKKLLFGQPEDFEGTIIQNFHPYFDELKPFMREWFSLLVLAYEYIGCYEYHNIHRRVLDILDRALASMTLEERDSEAGRKAVIESRRDSLWKLTDIPGGTQGLSGATFGSTTKRCNESDPTNGSPSSSPTVASKKLKRDTGSSR